MTIDVTAGAGGLAALWRRSTMAGPVGTAGALAIVTAWVGAQATRGAAWTLVLFVVGAPLFLGGIAAMSLTMRRIRRLA